MRSAAFSQRNGFDVSDQPGPIVDHLLCHLSFDDQGNGGLNVLKVEGGEDAIVRTNPANAVSGLGEISVVNVADSYADCYDAGGYFVIAGDDDGDDNACYWADVKVYDGIVDP